MCALVYITCISVHCCVHVHMHVHLHVSIICNYHIIFYVVSTQPSNVANLVGSVCFVLSYGEEVDKADVRCVQH